VDISKRLTNRRLDRRQIFPFMEDKSFRTRDRPRREATLAKLKSNPHSCHSNSSTMVRPSILTADCLILAPIVLHFLCTYRLLMRSSSRHIHPTSSMPTTTRTRLTERCRMFPTVTTSSNVKVVFIGFPETTS
jgi:hypothetical protein